MFKLLFLIIDRLFSLVPYLLGIGATIIAGGLLVYLFNWLFIESSVGPYLFGAAVIFIILMIIGSMGGKKLIDQ